MYSQKVRIWIIWWIILTWGCLWQFGSKNGKGCWYWSTSDSAKKNLRSVARSSIGIGLVPWVLQVLRKLMQSVYANLGFSKVASSCFGGKRILSIRHGRWSGLRGCHPTRLLCFWLVCGPLAAPNTANVDGHTYLLSSLYISSGKKIWQGLLTRRGVKYVSPSDQRSKNRKSLRSVNIGIRGLTLRRRDLNRYLWASRGTWAIGTSIRTTIEARLYRV